MRSAVESATMTITLNAKNELSLRCFQHYEVKIEKYLVTSNLLVTSFATQLVGLLCTTSSTEGLRYAQSSWGVALCGCPTFIGIVNATRIASNRPCRVAVSAVRIRRARPTARRS